MEHGSYSTRLLALSNLPGKIYAPVALQNEGKFIAFHSAILMSKAHAAVGTGRGASPYPACLSIWCRHQSCRSYLGSSRVLTLTTLILDSTLFLPNTRNHAHACHTNNSPSSVGELRRYELRVACFLGSLNNMNHLGSCRTAKEFKFDKSVPPRGRKRRRCFWY